MNTKFAATLTASKTPCVRNCCLDDHKICLGCGRSLPEILEWHHADDVRQTTIRHNARSRLKRQR